MDEHNKNQKTLIIAIIAAVALVVGLVLLFVLSGQEQGREQIVLPDPPAPVEDPIQEPEQEDAFAQVTTENVQNIVARLTRPTSYHQVLQITTTGGSHTRQQTAELWQDRNQLLTRTSDTAQRRSCLTDGTDFYLWYDGEDVVLQMKLDQDVSYDDLVGIPTYESIADLPTRLIKKAEFVTLPEEGAPQCVYLSYIQGGLTHEYWISLDTGLLYRQQTLDGEAPIYTLQQTSLEVLMGADEALADVFSLPDGRQPFAEDSAQ